MAPPQSSPDLYTHVRVVISIIVIVIAEIWKTTLLPWQREGYVVPDRPVAELFEQAWRRITEGDAPRFEEFTGRGGRTGGNR